MAHTEKCVPARAGLAVLVACQRLSALSGISPSPHVEVMMRRRPAERADVSASSMSTTLAWSPKSAAIFAVCSASPAALPVCEPNITVRERSPSITAARASETPAAGATAASTAAGAASTVSAAGAASAAALSTSSNLMTSTGQASAASTMRSAKSAPRVPVNGDFAPSFMSKVPSARTSARIIDESSVTLNTSGQMSSQALQVMQSGSTQTFAMTDMESPLFSLIVSDSSHP